MRCVGGLLCCVVSVVAICSGFSGGRLCRLVKTWLFSGVGGLHCCGGLAVFRSVVLQAAGGRAAAQAPKRAARRARAVGRLLPLGRKSSLQAQVFCASRGRWVQGLQVAGGLLQVAAVLQLQCIAPSAVCRLPLGVARWCCLGGLQRVGALSRGCYHARKGGLHVQFARVGGVAVFGGGSGVGLHVGFSACFWRCGAVAVAVVLPCKPSRRLAIAFFRVGWCSFMFLLPKTRLRGFLVHASQYALQHLRVKRGCTLAAAVVQLSAERYRQNARIIKQLVCSRKGCQCVAVRSFAVGCVGFYLCHCVAVLFCAACRRLFSARVLSQSRRKTRRSPLQSRKQLRALVYSYTKTARRKRTALFAVCMQ